MNNYTIINDRFRNQVTADVLQYAQQYKCTLADSLTDWEGDGPNGSFGLTSDEEEAVANYLKQLGYTLDTIVNDTRSCRNCGEKFQPKTRGQDCCSSECRTQLRTFSNAGGA